MAEQAGPARWTAWQAVVPLPAHIGSSNADQIREQLLAVIGRGAAVVVADLTATISCDYSGADALAGAYRRAVADGTELRLVVRADAVRRALSLSGLDQLASIYPTLDAAVAGRAGHQEAQGDREGRPGRRSASVDEVMSGFTAEVVNRLFSVGLSLESARSIVGDGPAGDRVAAATAEVDRMIGDIRTIMFSLAAEARDHSPRAWPLPPGGRAGRSGNLLDWVSDSLFEAGVALHAAADLSSGTAGGHIAEALARLDEVAQAIHDDVFARRTQPGAAGGAALSGQERPAPTADRAALLQARVAQTARAVQAAAAETAALLEQRAGLARQPARMDYKTESKRWRAFADQVGQMAQRWEQPPH